MKKQVATLVISTLIVLMLIGLLIFIILEYRTPASGKDSSPQEQSSQEKIPLTPVEAADINTITVANQTGTFTLINQGDSYAIQGLDDIKTSKITVNDLTASLTGLQALQLITEPTEDTTPLSQSVLSEFGLDAPAVSIKVLTVKQEEIELFLGNEAPSQSGTYLLYDGKVYLAESTALSAFQKERYSFVDNQVTETGPDTYDTATLVLSGTVRPAPVTIQIEAKPDDTATDTDTKQPTGEKDYSYKLTTPVERTISKDSADLVLDELFSFYANTVAAVDPTSEQMAEFGLADAFSILNADFDGSGFTIKASSPDENGYVYLMRDGNPVVYYAAANRIPWLTVQYEMLIQAIYTPADINDVSRLVVSSTDQAFDFVVSHEETGGMKVSCNGAEVDPQGFTQLFQTITPIPPKEYTQSEPTLQPALTMTVSYVKEDRPPDIIQLTPTGKGMLFLTVNGKTNYTAEEELVKMILENCQNTLDKKELTKLS